MATAIDPTQVRALTERLVGVRSVSPDPDAERACAAVIRGSLPSGIESGEWPTRDGRPVVWAMARGRSRRAVLVLGHYDTVGVSEFAGLGDERGEAVAFDPAALRSRFIDLAARSPEALGDALQDLEEEVRAPGSWLFGRGALDMKSGIAAGIAALRAMVTDRDALAGSILFVACPDEEVQSAGMLAALPELVRVRDAAKLDLTGVLNLDFADEPCAHAGVVGKLRVGLWVLGQPTHVGDPLRGTDAAQLAAAIARHATLSGELVERHEGTITPPASLLRLRDLKAGYDAQTAPEAEIELNVLTLGRPLEDVLERVRSLAVAAAAELAQARAGLRAARGGPGVALERARVVLYHELVSEAGSPAAEEPKRTPSPDVADATRERVRRIARAARLSGPAVVITLLPPYYPAADPGRGALVAATQRVAERTGLAVRGHYPHISDISYAAWRGPSEAEIARHLPALGREYALPVAAAQALDLDVVNVGPWGRGAHGLFERVRADDVFERLPQRIVDVTREALSGL